MVQAVESVYRCQLNLTVPDLWAQILQIYAEPMDDGQWIRVTAFPLPEEGDAVPLTDQTYSEDADAAAPFLQ